MGNLNAALFPFFKIEKIGKPFIRHIPSLLAYKERSETLTASAGHRVNGKITEGTEH